MQSDPIGLNGGVNTFLYVGASSLFFYDKTGEARGFKRKDIKDPNNWNGCEKVASSLRKKLGGGKKCKIKPTCAPSLGGYRGTNPGWAHHVVVVKDGKVFDAFTGECGDCIGDFKKKWDYPDDIDFGF